MTVERSSPRAVILLVLALALSPRTLSSQWFGCSGKLENPPPGEELATYEMRKLSDAQVGTLRQQLKNSSWAEALVTYTAQYQPELADWMVFIDEHGIVTQGVLADNYSSRLIRGKRHVWAMVFSDLPLKKRAGMKIEEHADTIDLRFSRRPLVIQPDPVIVGLLKGFAKGFGLDAPTVPTLGDSSRPMLLRQVSAGNDQMKVGFARFAIVDNALVELSLAPYTLKEFAPDPAGLVPQLERVYTNIANVKERTFELGLLAGVVRGWRVPIYDANLRLTQVSTVNDFGTYLTVVWNVPSRCMWFPMFLRPRWQRWSVGLYGGTNVISGAIGEQFTAGVSLGRLLGSAGLSGGIAWVPMTQLRGNSLAKVRQRRAMLGLDLRL